jgi:hypothetical protein
MRSKGHIFLVSCIVLLLVGGCTASSLKPTDARVIDYHAKQCLKSIETFTTRLYAKNPKYEKDKNGQLRKLRDIFAAGGPTGPFSFRSSRELLTEAFAEKSTDPDRVYLLGLGLVKSIREAYGLDERTMLLSAMQIDLGRLERLCHNLSQVNWRLKTYKDKDGRLLFLTNAAGDDGYVNMGYEVLMTEILTRIQDDIYLRGGLSEKYFFNMSTMFMSIIL